MDTVYEPISLGGYCEVKFQIIRHLYFKEFPKKSPISLRLMITGEDHGKRLYGWNMFDWQGTPIDIVIHYLENDFKGVFEREDLEIQDGHLVMHRRLNTNHAHDFHKATEWTTEDLDQAYPGVRSRFEIRAAKFRALLESPGPYLYVHLSDSLPEPDAIHRLLQLLGARNPEHRFHLLLVGPETESADASPYGGRVTFASRSGIASDDVKRDWEWWSAYDTEWDAALSRFDLVRDRNAIATSQPEAAPVLATPNPVKTSALFGRLGRKS